MESITPLTEGRAGWVDELAVIPEAARAAGAVENRMPIWTVAILSALLPRR